MYLNYPITGATIGHEIIHGFDSSGRNWDKKGMMKNDNLILVTFTLLNTTLPSVGEPS